jgi:hypothetical protein
LKNIGVHFVLKKKFEKEKEKEHYSWQKKIWNIINLHQNLKNWNFVSSEAYSKNQIDNPIYYALLVIFQKPKIIV